MYCNSPQSLCGQNTSVFNSTLYDTVLPQLPGLILLTHVISTIVTTSLNPADPAVKNKGHHTRPKFDPSVSGHVIENRYCRLCEAHVYALPNCAHPLCSVQYQFSINSTCCVVSVLVIVQV